MVSGAELRFIAAASCTRQTAAGQEDGRVKQKQTHELELRAQNYLKVDSNPAWKPGNQHSPATCLLLQEQDRKL
jgi:hypothetical protein